MFSVHLIRVQIKIMSLTQDKEGFKIMKKLFINTRKNKNGITLISLVVTIIILLILSGISIAMLNGENRNT